MKTFVVTSLLLLGPIVAAQDLQSSKVDYIPNQEKKNSLGGSVAPKLPPPPPYSNPRKVAESPMSNSKPKASRYSEPIPTTTPLSPGESPISAATFSEKEVTFQYMKKSPAQYQVIENNEIQTHTRIIYEVATTTISLDTELEKIELEGDAKRTAIQAITAVRHGKLLQALKDAKSETEKEEAAKKLQENYQAHYASETKWRLDRIAELEKRLEEMRSQVKERAAAEEKFLEAAMTLAKLNAQGIAAEPPQLKAPNASYNQSPLTQPYAPASTNYSTSLSPPSSIQPLDPPDTIGFPQPSSQYSPVRAK